MPRGKRKIVEKEPEIPIEVYRIAQRRARLCLRTAMKVPDLTMEQLVIGAYLQGVEDMGLALVRNGVRPVSNVPEFQVM